LRVLSIYVHRFNYSRLLSLHGMRAFSVPAICNSLPATWGANEEKPNMVLWFDVSGSSRSVSGMCGKGSAIEMIRTYRTPSLRLSSRPRRRRPFGYLQSHFHGIQIRFIYTRGIIRIRFLVLDDGWQIVGLNSKLLTHRI
jgi:hypothetical protein